MKVVEFTVKLLLPIPHVVDWFVIGCNLDYTFYKVWKKEMNCFYNAKVPGEIHLPLSESNSFDHSKSTFIDRLAFNTVINWSTFCSCTVFSISMYPRTCRVIVMSRCPWIAKSCLKVSKNPCRPRLLPQYGAALGVETTPANDDTATMLPLVFWSSGRSNVAMLM